MNDTATGTLDGRPADSMTSRSQGTASQKPRIAVLGAGPAGAAAAYKLATKGQAQVTVLEMSQAVGGNSGSFPLEGVWCDHGSHRFHPVADPEVLEDVKSLLGEDLLWRPRHGRIRLQGRWIHFPLKPLDLLLRLPKGFTASLAFDTLRKVLPGRVESEENFATVLRRGLGPTMSEAFYYPYVRKLWGLAPEDLAVTLARRRVSGSSVGKILGKVLRQVPGFKSPTAGGFYYPRKGFGQITEALHQAAEKAGANFLFGARVNAIECDDDGKVVAVRYEQDGGQHRRPIDQVWSTLPVGLLTRMMEPAAPAAVLQAADKIRFRGMILIYLVLEQQQFTEYDAHYFPELSVPISRLSEPKNYSATAAPQGCTVLCAELPSDPGEATWAMSDEELGEKLCGWLGDVGLPVKAPLRTTITRRLGHAYPVYDRDYESHFSAMDEWLAGVGGLLTYGRQGLFAHDNTHHAMAMAYAASECLRPDGSFDWGLWGEHRRVFETHVVED